MPIKRTGVRNFLGLLFLVIFLFGCGLTTTPSQQDQSGTVYSHPPQLGEKTAVPMGYVFHCIDYADSVFCVQKEEEE